MPLYATVVLTLLSALPLAPAAQALEPADTIRTSEVKDSIRIYFKVGKSGYDPALNDNRAVLAGYIDRIKALNSEGRLGRITVEGYVSPEGSDALNKRLAMRRSIVLADILEREAGISRSKITTIPVGINWDELRRLIAEHPNVPSRKALLRIINKTPIWVFDKDGNIIGGRKKSLMDLRGGRPYRWIHKHLFPEMRNAVAICLSCQELPPPVTFSATNSESDNYTSQTDTIGTVAPESEVIASESLISEEQVDTTVIAQQPADTVITPAYAPLHALALKTNLLYYPILLPNLELEWYINDKWSVTLEGNLAWWGSYNKNRSCRLLMVSPEVRRWFRRGPLRRGLFVGATAGFGYYDFLKDTRGYYGDGALAGLTVGYQWPIRRNLSLEGLIGGGYVYTKVKEYTPYEGHHVYQRTKKINYFGPIKLEFSLVWRFLDRNQSKQTIFGR